MHGRGSRRGSPGSAVDRLLTDLESEFDLMRLERYMADLVRKDERLAEEINALRARITPPEGASGCADLPETGPVRRWGRTLATGAFRGARVHA